MNALKYVCPDCSPMAEQLFDQYMLTWAKKMQIINYNGNNYDDPKIIELNKVMGKIEELFVAEISKP